MPRYSSSSGVPERTGVPERGAIEDHLVEFGGRGQRFELRLQLATRLLVAVGPLEQIVVEAVALGRPEHVVALDLHVAGELEQVPDARQEDRRRLARLGVRARTARSPARRTAAWTRSSRRHRRPGAECRRPRTPSARPPSTAGCRTRIRRSGRRHRRRRRARWSAFSPVISPSSLRVRPGGLLVGGDHETAGIGHATRPLHLQPGVGRSQHLRHPVALGIQSGTPRLRDEVLRHRLTETGRQLVTGTRAPPRLAGVGEEHHRPHDAVSERVTVAVRRVAPGPQQPVAATLVVDERDRVVVGTEGRAGEHQTAYRRLERGFDAVAPRPRVTGMVDLVEDDERLAGHRAAPVDRRGHADLGVGHDGAVEVMRRVHVGVAERGVELDADQPGRLRPLRLEVLGRRDDRDRVDGAVCRATPPRSAARTSSCRHRASRPRGSSRRDGAGNRPAPCAATREAAGTCPGPNRPPLPLFATARTEQR